MKVTFENLDEFAAFINRVSAVCPSKFGLEDKLKRSIGACQYKGTSNCASCWFLAIGNIDCNVIVDGADMKEVSYPND